MERQTIEATMYGMSRNMLFENLYIPLNIERDWMGFWGFGVLGDFRAFIGNNARI